MTYFERIDGRVNVELLSGKLVVIVGVGTVGSQIARELANSGVGHLRLVDGDRLEDVNLVRHVLSQEHVGVNKAKGLAGYLARIPNLHVDGVPVYVDDGMSDRDIDGILSDADLIVAATDDRTAQRRVARRALSLDTPTVFPTLYPGGGGEVFVQLSPRRPCFMCWDGFRANGEPPRGVRALNAETLTIIEHTVYLCHAILDEQSPFTAHFLGANNQWSQLFIQPPFGALVAKPAPWRPDCPSCAVGPAVEEPRATPAASVAFAPTPPVAESVVLQSPEPAPDRMEMLAAVVVGGFGGFMAAAVPASVSLAIFRETTTGYICFFLSFIICTSIGARLAVWVERKHPDWL